MKKINFLLAVLILFTSCNSLSDAGKVLRNEKIKTSDEFLVKKRKPLVLPPDYNEVPEPSSRKEDKIDEDQKIKSIIRSSENKKPSKNNSSSTEQSIINSIRK